MHDETEIEADLTPEDHAAAEPLKQRLVDSGMFRRDDNGRLVPVLPPPTTRLETPMFLMTAERIAAIEARLDAATRGPWQRSRFTDGPKHRGRSADWKADADRRERNSVIRGSGVVGTPDCNVVLVFARVKPEDMDLIAHAPGDLRALLAEREQLLSLLNESARQAKASQAELEALRGERVHGVFHETAAQQWAEDADRLEDEVQRLLTEREQLMGLVLDSSLQTASRTAAIGARIKPLEGALREAASWIRATLHPGPVPAVGALGGEVLKRAERVLGDVHDLPEEKADRMVAAGLDPNLKPLAVALLRKHLERKHPLSDNSGEVTP